MYKGIKIIAMCISKASKEFKASVGVYTTSSEGLDFNHSLKQSDDRMYTMKIGRPNRRKN